MQINPHERLAIIPLLQILPSELHLIIHNLYRSRKRYHSSEDTTKQALLTRISTDEDRLNPRHGRQPRLLSDKSDCSFPSQSHCLRWSSNTRTILTAPVWIHIMKQAPPPSFGMPHPTSHPRPTSSDSFFTQLTHHARCPDTPDGRARAPQSHFVFFMELLENVQPPHLYLISFFEPCHFFPPPLSDASR